jgi:hypothetical protein
VVSHTALGFLETQGVAGSLWEQMRQASRILSSAHGGNCASKPLVNRADSTSVVI